jgi:SAM-dependent methyltransferase
VSRNLASRVGGNGTVVGIDLGEAMLEVARGLGSPADGATIEYHQGEAGALPVPDGAFDVVTCQHGFQFFPDKPAALAEFQRVLVPGGTVAIACWNSVETAPTFEAMADALEKHVGPDAAAAMRMPFSLDAEALGELVTAAGFEDVSATRETISATFPSHDGLVRQGFEAGPVAPIFNGASEEAQAAIVADATAATERYANADGGLTAPITTAIAIARSPA